MSAAGILIAEYEYSVAQDLKVRLEALGYRVVDIAYSGEEVLEKTERLRPNVVLMNTRLLGTADHSQTGSHNPGDTDIPIVYVVDYGSQATIRRVGATGPFGYIFRPFDQQQAKEVPQYNDTTGRGVFRYTYFYVFFIWCVCRP